MEKLTTIRTLSQLRELTAYLKRPETDFVAYDTETDGVEKSSHIIGFSVCASLEEAFYVILSYWDVEKQQLIELETMKGAADCISALVGKNLIMHNAPFDCWMTVNNFGVQLIDDVHTDTMILGHILDENRSNGLKELGLAIFGEDADKEQRDMKESVTARGGVLTKDQYELYKAEPELLAKYGAKDALLTLKLFYHLVPQLFEEGLDKFFYEEESMPLLKGPTYELNTVGLRIDPNKLQQLRATLEAECMEAKAFIQKEIAPYVSEKYPGTSKANTFNINSGEQLAWLLFERLENDFLTLTDAGRELCAALELRRPYSNADKAEFIVVVREHFERVWREPKYNWKKKKYGNAAKVKNPWCYMSTGKDTLAHFSKKYEWVKRFVQYKKNLKLMNTYVDGIASRMQYNIIRPSFFQHGTTSGRYSSRKPNFQNLPRDDKRIKSCVVARPGKVLVGADYSQLEPRVFASVSGDPTLCGCFAKGEDFYSVVGAPIYGKDGLSLFKSEPGSFAKLFPVLRDQSKIISLATPYGRTAWQMARALGIPVDEAQSLIDSYFAKYPKVEAMMLESHEQAMTSGVVHTLYGRPRRIPAAKNIRKEYGNLPHGELPYAARTLLNLAMNHRVQGSGASIMNRAAIAFYKAVQERAATDPGWKEVHIVLQVHDELVAEGPEPLEAEIKALLKHCMENTTTLPGVALEALPNAGHNLAELK